MRTAVVATAVGALPQTPGFSEAWLRCPIDVIQRPLTANVARGPMHLSAYRRSGYSLSGCVPAEPDYASPDRISLTPLSVAGISFGALPQAPATEDFEE
jgi:hypothetical protein